MQDSPRITQARATLVHAARRLATALGPRAEIATASMDVRALRLAVTAYAISYGTGRTREELAEMVVTRVRSALWTDDFTGHTESVIARVIDIARQAVLDAVPE